MVSPGGLAPIGGVFPLANQVFQQDSMTRRRFGFFPAPQAVRNNRWLRWLGPALHSPYVWRVSCRGIALGMAVGVFFGLLIPLAQIPLAAGAAVALRANVPAAMASTLVTNPVTFGPVYYAAWRLGSAILGEPVREGEQPPEIQPAPQATGQGWFATAWERVRGVGKPLVLGLAILATAVGMLTYLLVTWIWYARVLWTRRQRRRNAQGAGVNSP